MLTKKYPMGLWLESLMGYVFLLLLVSWLELFVSRFLDKLTVFSKPKDCAFSVVGDVNCDFVSFLAVWTDLHTSLFKSSYFSKTGLTPIGKDLDTNFNSHNSNVFFNLLLILFIALPCFGIAVQRYEKKLIWQWKRTIFYIWLTFCAQNVNLVLKWEKCLADWENCCTFAVGNQVMVTRYINKQ